MNGVVIAYQLRNAAKVSGVVLRAIDTHREGGGFKAESTRTNAYQATELSS